MRVAAIILAAGEGRRMGGPKAFLRLGPATFLEACVAALGRPSVDSLVVVLGHQADRVRATIPLPPAVTVVDNPRYRDGMLGSIWRGLDAAEGLDAQAVLLHPVDHPAVEPDTVDRVVAALRVGALIAVPSHAGRRGHPGGFAREVWPALRAAEPERGARAVMADHPEWVVHVEGGPGCVAGVDTPADLKRLQR